jgi:hypothetical protein
LRWGQEVAATDSPLAGGGIMSSPAIIPEMRVHCDDSQAEQNTASFPASANPVQCGGPGSPATTRNCGACSELRGRLRSASNIHRLNPADKAEICCHADLSVLLAYGNSEGKPVELRTNSIASRRLPRPALLQLDASQTRPCKQCRQAEANQG